MYSIYYEILFRDIFPLSLPLAKESPFLEPIKKVLFEMKKSGVIENIWRNHQTNVDTVCEERKVEIDIPLNVK